MVKLSTSGSFDKTINHINKISGRRLMNILHRYGKLGVEALQEATPIKTGTTAASWYYKIVLDRGHSVLEFCNSNIVEGVPVAIILQYGHATRNGGYVTGVDYISPALEPVFKELADKAWREVTL